MLLITTTTFKDYNPDYNSRFRTFTKIAYKAEKNNIYKSTQCTYVGTEYHVHNALVFADM